MAEQRLIDANIMAQDESEAYLKAQTSGQISPITQGLNSVVHRKIQQLISDTPTIDPETMPIVQELREELERVTRERDSAIKKLRETEWCNGCKNFIGLKGCSIGELVTCNPKNDMYVFGYKE